MFSVGMIFLKRSKVCCSKERPVPKKSRNCLGCVLRLNGQKRLPIPPPMMTQKLSLFVAMIVFILKFLLKYILFLEIGNICPGISIFFILNQCDAQMAESVDALVSNTSGFTSIPVRPRVWVLKRRKMKIFLLFCYLFLVIRWFAER